MHLTATHGPFGVSIDSTLLGAIPATATDRLTVWYETRCRDADASQHGGRDERDAPAQPVHRYPAERVTCRDGGREACVSNVTADPAACRRVSKNQNASHAPRDIKRRK